MANDVTIRVNVQNHTHNSFAQINQAITQLTQNASQASGAVGGGGSGGRGLVGALGGVGAVIGMSALPAIGALAPMLFGLAGVGGAAALAMKDIKEEAKKLKPEFEELQQVASKAVMPGVRDALKDVKVAMKELHPVIEVGGKAFGDTAREAAKFAKSPAFQSALLKNVKMGSEWFKEFSRSLGSFTQSFLDFGTKSKPTLDALGGGINDLIGESIPGMFSKLEKGIEGSAKMWDGFFNGLDRVLVGIGDLSGSFANTFGPFLGAFFERIGMIADAIVVLLTPAIDELKPLFDSMAQTLGLADGATLGLAKGIGEVLGGAIKLVMPLFKNWFDLANIVVPIIMDLASAIAGPLLSAFMSTTGAGDKVNSLTASLEGWSNWVANHREEIRSFFTGVSVAIMDMVIFAVDHIPQIYDSFAFTVKGILNLMGGLIMGAEIAFGWIPGIGDKINGLGKQFSDWQAGVEEDLDAAGEGIRDFRDNAIPKLEQNKLKLQIDNWMAQISVAEKEMRSTTSKERKAQLKANIDQLLEKVRQANGAVATVRGKTVVITTVHRHLEEHAQGPLWKATGGVVGTAATGGIRSNRVLVGEQGPEIVDLPPGSRVHSNPDTRRMMAGSGGGDGGLLHLTLELGGQEFAEMLIDPLRRAVNRRGGVQATFGKL
ncbi:hypothetical protein ACFO9E_18140 [Streptomyces maoxianensis]|uniref:Phage tail protein n=1 Tax=Streptomyces maoxianensis TaxID=1459942 RepID=A0ABV9GAT6_9ACTN